MSYTLIIGRYSYHGYYRSAQFDPFRNQNTTRYKTINGARKAAYNRLMEYTYDWASEESPIVYIKSNGRDYGYMEQAIKGKRKFIVYTSCQTSSKSEVLSNGSLTKD